MEKHVYALKVKLELGLLMEWQNVCRHSFSSNGMNTILSV